MASDVEDSIAGSPRRLFLLAALATVALDLITKLIAEATLLRTPGISVMGDWFQLRLVYNQGAAFGLHVGPYSRWIFFAVALITFCAVSSSPVVPTTRPHPAFWAQVSAVDVPEGPEKSMRTPLPFNESLVSTSS